MSAKPSHATAVPPAYGYPQHSHHPHPQLPEALQPFFVPPASATTTPSVAVPYAPNYYPNTNTAAVMMAHRHAGENLEEEDLNDDDDDDDPIENDNDDDEATSEEGEDTFFTSH